MSSKSKVAVFDASKMVLDVWQTKRSKLVRDKEFQGLSDRQQVLQDRLDRLLMNRGLIKKNPTWDECPFCGAGIHVDNLDKRIQEAQYELEAIEKEKEQLNAFASSVDKKGKELKSKISIYETQKRVYETLKTQVEGKGD